MTSPGLPSPRSWTDIWLAVQAAGLITALAVALKLLRLDRVRAFLERSAARPPRRDSPADVADDLVRVTTVVTRVAASGRVPANCLRQSLALWWLLRRRGIAGEVRLGVRREDGRIRAHAWVEHQGVVISDEPEDVRRYTPFEGTVGSADWR